MTLKIAIIAWFASLLPLALWVYFVFLLAVASWGNLELNVLIIFYTFLFYNLFILLPMALIAKLTRVNPLKLSLVMYVPFALLMVYWLIGDNAF